MIKTICCKSCGASITLFADIHKCKKCGHPVLNSIDPSTTIYSAEHIAPEIDPEEEVRKLIEMVMPAIIDRNQTEETKTIIYNYFSDKYKGFYPYADLDLFEPIEQALKRSISQREYDKKQNDFMMRIALNTYNTQMSAPVQGLGFSVITNDFISAASYLVMAKRNVQKQLYKQEAAAQKNWFITESCR